MSFPGPGLPKGLRHSADVPAIPEPVLEPRRRPDVPAGFPPLALCTVTSDQLRRQDDGPRAACTTNEDASATAIRKTLSATEADNRPQGGDV